MYRPKDTRNLPATVTNSAALLERKQLLGSEALVVNLASGLDQVLKVGTSEEIAEVDEFAVVLVLDIDDTPLVLSAANSATVDVECLLAADDGKRNDGLFGTSVLGHCRGQDIALP